MNPNSHNNKLYANGGVVGQEITFDFQGDEKEGVIKEITDMGDFIVSTNDGRTVLAEERDVIKLGDMHKNEPEPERKKRFGLFADGGELGGEPRELKGYRVNIFSSDYKSDLNLLNGKNSAILVTDGKTGDSSTVMSNEPYLKLITKERFNRTGTYMYAEPVNYGKEGDWRMFGGTFVWSSDSRFRDKVSEQPIQLHDRVEYATGGMTEHGLEIGDEILGYTKKVNELHVKNSNNAEWHSVDLDDGKRYENGGSTNMKYKIFEGYDHFNNKSLYKVTDNEDYEGEWYSVKSDAEKELNEMNNADKMATGGVFKAGGAENIKLRSWYMKNYPSDTEGADINKISSFEDLWNGIHLPMEIYVVIGVADSIIRERLFSELAKIKDVDYNYIYNKWLEDPEYSKGGELGKNYYEQYGVGKSKYVVNYYDGQKRHKDGSEFYDIAIFKNKPALQKFLNKLNSEGYKRKMATGGSTMNYEFGGSLDEKFTIKEIRTYLDNMFPDSFSFSLSRFSEEGNIFKNEAALIVNPNESYYGLSDNEINSSLFFPKYQSIPGIRFRIYQGGENTYFYFILESQNQDLYIGQFGFKDRGNVPSNYITKFLAFLMEQYGLPFEVNHKVMSTGGGVSIKALYQTNQNEKLTKQIIDTSFEFFKSNGVNYGQVADLGTEITIEPSTVIPAESTLKKGSLDGMQIIYDIKSKVYEVSEYMAGPNEDELYIFGEYKSFIPALKSLIKGNSSTGRKPIKKYKRGGKLTAAQEAKVGKVMSEFKAGELHSGSKTGPIVKKRDQAVAIALAEANASRKMSTGGELGKNYYEQYGVGKSKYVVNYYDGKNRHKDGSEFYDIAIFKNKPELQKFLNKLNSEGYKRKMATGGKITEREGEGLWSVMIDYYDPNAKADSMGIKLTYSSKTFKVNAKSRDEAYKKATELYNSVSANKNRKIERTNGFLLKPISPKTELKGWKHKK